MNYSDIYIGQQAEVTHTITEKNIQQFVELTGDDNRLHVDAEFAKKTAFKKQVAHGMLGASFISTVIGTKLPGDGALWYTQNLEFLLPVRIGDTITVKAEVIKKVDREKVIELSTIIYNQDKQKVTTGTAKVKIVPILEAPKEANEQEITHEKIALVLGASGGIGLATTKKLLATNYKVIAHFNKNITALEKIKATLKQPENLLLIQADLTVPSGLEKITDFVLRYTTKLNSLVYTSSPSIPNINFDQLDWSDFTKQLKLHVEVPFLLVKKLENVLAEGNAGIVFITTQSVEQPFSKLTHYTTAKSALYGLMKSLAIDLSSKKIRVNAVSPGITDTELNANLPTKVKLITAAKTPLKRLAEPTDVAQAIVFLANSSMSGFVTGETIRVNGGQIMW